MVYIQLSQFPTYSEIAIHANKIQLLFSFRTSNPLREDMLILPIDTRVTKFNRLTSRTRILIQQKIQWISRNRVTMYFTVILCERWSYELSKYFCVFLDKCTVGTCTVDRGHILPLNVCINCTSANNESRTFCTRIYHHWSSGKGHRTHSVYSKQILHCTL